MRRSPLYRATTILLNKGLIVKRNIFMFCRPSTEKLFIGILATLASMCEAVFWPPYLKLSLKVVLRYGTFDFEGDFWIHDFDHCWLRSITMVNMSILIFLSNPNVPQIPLSIIECIFFLWLKFSIRDTAFLLFLSSYCVYILQKKRCLWEHSLDWKNSRNLLGAYLLIINFFYFWQSFRMFVCLFSKNFFLLTTSKRPYKLS